jgi:hypothetical protein
MGGRRRSRGRLRSSSSANHEADSNVAYKGSCASEIARRLFHFRPVGVYRLDEAGAFCHCDRRRALRAGHTSGCAIGALAQAVSYISMQMPRCQVVETVMRSIGAFAPEVERHPIALVFREIPMGSKPDTKERILAAFPRPNTHRIQQILRMHWIE